MPVRLLPPPRPTTLSLLHERCPDVFREEILTRLSVSDRQMLARVDRRSRAAVLASASDLPRAGVSEDLPLRLTDFVGSVERLRWAASNGAPRGGSGGRSTSLLHDEATLLLVAGFGGVRVLRWLLKRVRRGQSYCGGNEMIPAAAARRGNLTVLRWAISQTLLSSKKGKKRRRDASFEEEEVELKDENDMNNDKKNNGDDDHDDDDDDDTGNYSDDDNVNDMNGSNMKKDINDGNVFFCGDYTFSRAAEGGHIATMQFLRDFGCPWTAVTCADAAGAGQLEAGDCKRVLRVCFS